MTDEQVAAEALSSWSFIDRIPTTDEMLELLGSLNPVYSIEVKNYAEFVLPLTQDQKFKTDAGQEYKPVTKLYCTVAGRVKMLGDAQEMWDWTVTEKWKLVHKDPLTLRMRVKIVSDGELLGTRFGVSKFKGGDSAWEKAETAARGRAIAAWGFGVLPGSGIASLEEMQDALFGERPAKEEKKARSRQEVMVDVIAAIEELRQLRGQDAAELDASLQEYITNRLGDKVAVSEKGLDLAKMKDGNLLLLEGQVRSKIKEERRAQSEI